MALFLVAALMQDQQLPLRPASPVEVKEVEAAFGRWVDNFSSLSFDFSMKAMDGTERLIHGRVECDGGAIRTFAEFGDPLVVVEHYLLDGVWQEHSIASESRRISKVTLGADKPFWLRIIDPLSAFGRSIGLGLTMSSRLRDGSAKSIEVSSNRAVAVITFRNGDDHLRLRLDLREQSRLRGYEAWKEGEYEKWRVDYSVEEFKSEAGVYVPSVARYNIGGRAARLLTIGNVKLTGSVNRAHAKEMRLGTVAPFVDRLTGETRFPKPNNEELRRNAQSAIDEARKQVEMAKSEGKIAPNASRPHRSLGSWIVFAFGAMLITAAVLLMRRNNER